MILGGLSLVADASKLLSFRPLGTLSRQQSCNAPGPWKVGPLGVILTSRRSRYTRAKIIHVRAITSESGASQKQNVNGDDLSHDMYLRRVIGDAGRPHAVACLTERVTDINPRDKQRF